MEENEKALIEIGKESVRRAFHFLEIILEPPLQELGLLAQDRVKLWRIKQQVKIIKRIKPKIPLIVISDDIESVEGGKIYEEGVFHLAQKPIDKNIIKEIISASINTLKQNG